MPDELPSGPFHRTAGAAKYLARFGIKVTPATLVKRRRTGTGPLYLRDRSTRAVTYPQAWLDTYARELLQPARSTAEEGYR